MGNITSMVVLYVGSCKFHRNYVSVSSIIYMSVSANCHMFFAKILIKNRIIDCFFIY